MFTGQQVTGPRAPGQYDPMQVSGPGAYYPTQTDPTSGMFSAMMPMIMMVMMMTSRPWLSAVRTVGCVFPTRRLHPLHQRNAKKIQTIRKDLGCRGGQSEALRVAQNLVLGVEQVKLLCKVKKVRT